jgi:hypothetical protein
MKPAFYLIITSLLLLGTLFASREIGAYARRRRELRNEAAAAAKFGLVMSGVLGLLALLVGFTFSLALNRFETRRDLIVQEANALDTAYLRTAVLDQPQPLRQQIRNYTELRVRMAESSRAEERALEPSLAVARRNTWAAAADEARTGGGVLPMFLLTPLNSAFDLRSAQIAEQKAQIPPFVMWALFLYATLSAGLIGFVAFEQAMRTASYVFFLLMTLALTLVIDLDQPRIGAIRVPIDSLTDTLAGMQAKANRPREPEASGARPMAAAID